MSVPIDMLVAAPIPIGLLIVLLRGGPKAVLVLVAGLVALLTRDPARADRALAVLRLIHGPSRGRRSIRKKRADMPDQH